MRSHISGTRNPLEVLEIQRTHSSESLAHAAGYPEVTNMTYLASSGLCIGAIACLANQSTARVGNALGLMGVSGGIAATLGLVNGDPALYGQILGRFSPCEDLLKHLNAVLHIDLQHLVKLERLLESRLALSNNYLPYII